MGFKPLDLGEHPKFKKVLTQIAAGSLALLVIAVILGILALFNMDRMLEQLELKTYDLRAQIQWGQNNQKPSRDIVILQFDDPTLKVLSDEYGEWPWPRSVHADMIEFLNRAGVKDMIYDIMFTAHHKGNEAADARLVEAFHHYNNVYLSMNFDNELAESQKLGKDLTPSDIELLKPLAISMKSELQPEHNQFLKLKADPSGGVFFDNDHITFNHFRSILPGLLDKKRNIAIINHGADMDGVSRANPLFFRLQYQAFFKTPYFPLKKVWEHWFDSHNQRTDEDGYLLAHSSYLPAVKQKDGRYLDRDPLYPHWVDQDGYAVDDFGHYLYQRDTKLSTLYFPYLGMKVLLDLKFGKNMPQFQLTKNGHLQFPGYDIPLRSNGDFLLQWYNTNVQREEYQKNQRALSQAKVTLVDTVAKLETDLKQTTDHEQVMRLQNEIKAKQIELQQAQNLLALFDQALQEEYVPQPYQVVSAWQVIRAMNKEKSGTPLDGDDLKLKAFLKNKIVFIGATAIAAYDIKNTSINPTLPGVFIQANLFDNLYQNKRYIHPLSPNINLIVTILICLLAAGCIFKMRSALAGLLTIANIAVIYTLCGILLYQHEQIWVNIATPVTALVLTTTVTFMVKYIMRDKDYEKTYALATTDSMTGLYNHRFFQEHMRRSIEQAIRFKHQFSLILIDIDFFKKFNDSYGHQAGDEVLRQVARKLKKSVRTVDVVARYGGEEMAIILDRASAEEALSVAQKVVQAIAEEAYPIAEGVSKHVTISCGVATYPLHGEEPSHLIEFADAGLYRAKENGRNQVGAQYDSPEAEAQASAVHAVPNASQEH